MSPRYEGKPTLTPAQQKKRSRIEELEASGALRRSGKTTADLATFTRIKLPEGAPDPMQLLLEDRYSESDWEREFREAFSVTTTSWR